MVECLTGSTYFFGLYPDFKSKDIDWVILLDNPQGFSQIKQISSESECKFYVARHTPEEYIDWYVHTICPMSAIKFLTKEFCEEVGFTIEHLKQLRSVFERLDDKHKYAKVIFDAYIANNDFILTDDQRNAAYECYKAARPEYYKI